MKVNVEILQKPVPFPAVSVCNVDHIDFEIASRLSDLAQSLSDESLSDDYDENYTIGNSSDYDYLAYDYDNLMAQAPTQKLNNTDFVSNYRAFLDNVFYFMPAYEAFDAGTEFTLEALSRLALPANLGVNISASGGVRLKDFIINCRFMDDDCDISKSFENIFDPYYFNCFTFNPDKILPSRAMRLRGVDYGMSLLLFIGSAGQVRTHKGNSGDGNQTQQGFFFPGVEESESALAGGRGARVVVHSPDTRPFPTAEGYDIPPGFSVTIGAKARENKRIHNPHGNCTDGAVDSTTSKEFKYTLMSCQNECIQDYIMSSCDCVDNRLSLPSDSKNNPFCFTIPEAISHECIPMEPVQNASVVQNNPLCANLKEWKKRMGCRRKVYDDMMIYKPEAMEQCNCFPPCHDIVYDTSYSLSKLPEDPEGHAPLQFSINHYLKYLSGTRRDLLIEQLGGEENKEKGLLKQLSRLNVHIADNNVMRTTESPDYEAIRLVSDIGGQLGLWIGISVMTLFEVLQLIADVFRYLTAKGRNVGEKKVNMPNTISGAAKRTYGNGDRFRHNPADIELTCEIDKLTTV